MVVIGLLQLIFNENDLPRNLIPAENVAAIRPDKLFRLHIDKREVKHVAQFNDILRRSKPLGKIILLMAPNLSSVKFF